MTIRKNSLNQSLDISGSRTQSQSKTLSEEPSKYGQTTGQSGLLASITVGANVVLTGLTGITANSVGNFLQISNATNSNNNGTFKITTFNSVSSVNIENSSAATDANNGNIFWIERSPYTLEDDINFIRTDRKLIKGTTNYYDPIPQYVRPDDTLVDVDTNLTNISGKTLDAHAWIEPRFKENITINPGDDFITIIDSGNLKHADSTDILGIPISDGYDSGNYKACFVEIVDGYIDGYGDGANLRVLFGAQAGERIFGLTREGSSTSPNSVEIEFFSAQITDWNLSSITSYSWESGQPETVNVSYGYRQRLDLFDESAIRSVLIKGALSGSSGGSSGSAQLPTPNQIGQVLFAVSETEFTVETPLTAEGGWLVNDSGVLLVVG